MIFHPKVKPESCKRKKLYLKQGNSYKTKLTYLLNNRQRKPAATILLCPAIKTLCNYLYLKIIPSTTRISPKSILPVANMNSAGFYNVIFQQPIYPTAGLLIVFLKAVTSAMPKSIKPPSGMSNSANVKCLDCTLIPARPMGFHSHSKNAYSTILPFTEPLSKKPSSGIASYRKPILLDQTYPGHCLTIATFSGQPLKIPTLKRQISPLPRIILLTLH